MNNLKYSHRKIKVYETLAPSEIAPYITKIARILFGYTIGQEKHGFASLEINDNTGYWHYKFNAEKLGNNYLKGVNEQGAVNILEGFFKNASEKLNSAVKRKELPEELQGLFGMRFMKRKITIPLEQIPNTDKSRIWEFHFQTELPSVEYVQPVNSEWENTLREEKSVVYGNKLVLKISENQILSCQYNRLPIVKSTRKKMFNLLGESDIIDEFQRTAKTIYKAYPELAQIIPFVQTINGEILPVTEEGILALDTENINARMPFKDGIWVLPMTMKTRAEQSETKNYLFYFEKEIYEHDQITKYNGEDKFVLAVKDMLNFLLETQKGKFIVEDIQREYFVRIIRSYENQFRAIENNCIYSNHIDGQLVYETENKKVTGMFNKKTKEGILPPVVTLFHELVHAYNNKNNRKSFPIYGNNEEDYVVSEWESPLIDELNAKVNIKDPKVIIYIKQDIIYGKRSCYECVHDRIFEVLHPCSPVPKNEELMNQLKNKQGNIK